MPNRLIRDGLLDNDRYWSVTIEARQLFLHLMLLADDFGCVSLAPLFLRRRCFNDTPTNEKIAKLTGELADVDLIRCYEHEGAVFAFIPRFRQRLQRATLKHPMPPVSLLAGDDDAISKFNKIKDKPENPTVRQPLHSVGQPPEVKGSEEKKPLRPRFALPEWVPQEAWKCFEETRQKLRKPLTDRARQLAVAELQRLRDAGHDPVAVIERTVLRGWQTFYPLDKAESTVKRVAL